MLSFFSFFKHQTYCSRDEGEPSYYKLMTDISRHSHSIMHLFVVSVSFYFVILWVASARGYWLAQKNCKTICDWQFPAFTAGCIYLFSVIWLVNLVSWECCEKPLGWPIMKHEVAASVIYLTLLRNVKLLTYITTPTFFWCLKLFILMRTREVCKMYLRQQHRGEKKRITPIRFGSSSL